jgi:DNA polymerase-3 subunit epsilon
LAGGRRNSVWPRATRRGNERDGAAVQRERDVVLTPRITDADRAAHRDFVATLGEKALWRDYLPGA